ncbi:hypothetical protein HDU86_001823 [Geranomyces michiganensis]|nr:hypothetical protein HDU86_001823 [Geranomyces michiganensis]
MASSSSHPSYSHSPAFRLRYPLGKSFASAGFKVPPPSSTRPRSSPSPDIEHSHRKHVTSRTSAPQPRTRTGDEYVRNLQQQIYLLELETRYLRAGRSDDSVPFPLAGAASAQQPQQPPDATGERTASGPAAPLGEVIQDLRSKYVELQESYRSEVETLKAELSTLRTSHAAATAQLPALRKEVASLSAKLAATESASARTRESLQVELSTATQRLEAAGSEIERWEALYEDGVKSTEEVRKDAASAHVALVEEKSKVLELEAVKKKLERRVEELCAENAANKHAPLPAPADQTTGALQALQATLQTLQGSLTALSNTHTPQATHIATLTTQLQVAQHANAGLASRVEQLESELLAVKTRAGATAQRNADLERSAALLGADLNRAVSARASLTSRLTSLTALTTAHQVRIAELETQLQTAGAGSRRAEEEAAALRKERDEAKQTATQLEAALEEATRRVKQVKRVEELVKVAEERGDGYIEIVRQLKGGLREGGVWSV